MRIIIVGAGAVGGYIAERLSLEGQDVVVIEINPRRAEEIRERLDALVITGNGASASILADAGADEADLLLAVSTSDGANIIACHTATKMGVPRTVARVQDPGLKEGLEGLDVDFLIDPVESAAKEIAALVSESGVSELIEFGGGKLALVGGTVTARSPLIGIPLRRVRGRLTEFRWLAIAVVRHGTTIVAHGDTTIREGDHLLLMVRSHNVERGKALIGIHGRKIRRALIIGTTRVARLTADHLVESGLSIVVVDPDMSRCRDVAERHPSALVIAGDPTDPEVYNDLGIDQGDAVVALTGIDSINLIGSLVAKALGASTTITRVTRMSYVGLLAGIGVDTTVSTRLAAAAQILRFVRRGNIHSVATFSDTDAEVIEIEVEPDSEAVGRTLLELPLPSGAVIGGILRGDSSFVPSGVTSIRAHDHLIIFTIPTAMARVESLFTT